MPGRGARVLRVGVRERPHERGFPRVRRAEEHPLPRAFPGHVSRIEPLRSRAPGSRLFLFELRDALSEIRLDLLGALVFRQEREHLAQRLELLHVRGRLAEPLLRFLVLRRQVCRHGVAPFDRIGTTLYTRRTCRVRLRPEA